MCGIVGLFLKDKALEPQLGALTNQMLGTMCDRGPDSAGIAIYARPAKGRAKLTVQSSKPEIDFKNLAKDMSKSLGSPVKALIKNTHVVLDVPAKKLEAARAAVATATRINPSAKRKISCGKS